MKQLQLVSLQFCLACRASGAFHVIVNHRTLPWLQAESPGSAVTKKAKSTRVPRMRPGKATWNLQGLFLVSLGDLCSNVVCLAFGNRFNEPLDNVVWPRTLRRLELGDYFNKSIDAVSFSPVQELSFGDDFSRPVADVAWPASLQKLTFGLYFNEPIRQVSWPRNLQELELGYCFNQPLDNVRWPTSLQRLKFGREFYQPIRVAWPASLRELTIGGGFGFPIEGIEWPPSFQKLTVGGKRVTGIVRQGRRAR